MKAKDHCRTMGVFILHHLIIWVLNKVWWSYGWTARSTKQQPESRFWSGVARESKDEWSCGGEGPLFLCFLKKSLRDSVHPSTKVQASFSCRIKLLFTFLCTASWILTMTVMFQLFFGFFNKY